MNLRSMTGFARIVKSLPDGELIFSLKSVNHRALDLHFHMPSDLDQYEAAIRAILKGQLNRGHVQVQVQLNGNVGASSGFNRELMRNWVDAFRVAKSEFRFKSEPDLNAALRFPGMLQGTNAPRFRWNPFSWKRRKRRFRC